AAVACVPRASWWGHATGSADPRPDPECVAVLPGITAAPPTPARCSVPAPVVRLLPTSRSSPSPNCARPGGSPVRPPGSVAAPTRLRSVPVPAGAATAVRSDELVPQSAPRWPATPPTALAGWLRGTDQPPPHPHHRRERTGRC